MFPVQDFVGVVQRVSPGFPWENAMDQTGARVGVRAQPNVGAAEDAPSIASTAIVNPGVCRSERTA
jgi:hypothetical protein